MNLTVIILAAGKGSRIKSEKPKSLQKLAGKTLIRHVIETVESLKANKIIVVKGHLGKQIKSELKDKKITWSDQKQRLGTGHAILKTLQLINKEEKILILYGDVPLISNETLNNLIKKISKKDLGILTTNVDNPTGLGRILRNKFKNVKSIKEEKDANTEEKKIKEINTGIYCVYGKHLHSWIKKINNKNSQKEYYLTDIVNLAYKNKINIKTSKPINNFEILGINTRHQLADLERILQKHISIKIMNKGVSIIDPKRFDVRGTIDIEYDTVIDINVIIKGKVKIGKNCKIGANCILKNCIIKNNVEIKPNSIINKSYIKNNSIIGPFTRIRPYTIIEKYTKIGNFVEIKKSKISKYSKINHLSYIGNSFIGIKCNIGAGVITCNFDSNNKYYTIIENNVFVGSNCQIIAPVHLGRKVKVGAGSIITENIPSYKLTINRNNKQKTIKKIFNIKSKFKGK